MNTYTDLLYCWLLILGWLWVKELSILSHFTFQICWYTSPLQSIKPPIHRFNHSPHAVVVKTNGKSQPGNRHCSKATDILIFWNRRNNTHSLDISHRSIDRSFALLHTTENYSLLNRTSHLSLTPIYYNVRQSPPNYQAQALICTFTN